MADVLSNLGFRNLLKNEIDLKISSNLLILFYHDILFLVLSFLSWILSFLLIHCLRELNKTNGIKPLHKPVEELTKERNQVYMLNDGQKNRET